jgi:23S rRNA (adenine2030-N6)-methyltransferase
MFSYRHAFHAGNHADVLKHSILVAMLRYMTQKDTALTVVDTHAGAGLYRLDGDQARTSGEAESGIFSLLGGPNLKISASGMGKLVDDYLAVLREFNPPPKGSPSSGPFKLRHYPGSPLITEKLLRPQDRAHVFEVHPTDQRLLRGLVAQRDSRRIMTLRVADGFTGVRALLPPPSRRGLLVCDPSYEIKSDYAKVVELLTDALTRFATGSALIWHPIVARPEAHDLPRKLKNAATRAGKPWLYASLSVKSGQSNARGVPMGLSGSGVFVVNPPFVLAPALKESLPFMVKALGQDEHAGFVLEQGK